MSYNHQCPTDGQWYRILEDKGCVVCGEGVPVNALGEPSPGRTDFSKWTRGGLEMFAREAADENLVLRNDLKYALASWRQAVKENLK